MKLLKDFIKDLKDYMQDLRDDPKLTLSLVYKSVEKISIANVVAVPLTILLIYIKQKQS